MGFYLSTIAGTEDEVADKYYISDQSTSNQWSQVSGNQQAIKEAKAEMYLLILKPAPVAPWVIDGKGKSIMQKAFIKLVHSAIEKEYQNTQYHKLMASLKGHSFRVTPP